MARSQYIYTVQSCEPRGTPATVAFTVKYECVDYLKRLTGHNHDLSRLVVHCYRLGDLARSVPATEFMKETK